MAREILQQQRRRRPQRQDGRDLWLVGLLLVPCLWLLLVQCGRGLAGLISRGSWAWPGPTETVSSILRVLTGDGAAGLPAGAPVPASWAVLLCTWGLQVALVAAAVWGFAKFGDDLGGRKVRGMASRKEAVELLGTRRLRDVRSVVRPDLYPASSTGRSMFRKGA